MMKLYKTETKTIQKKIVHRKTTGIKCDRCGKVIPCIEVFWNSEHYFYVRTGHHDWGNDSIESIEYFDICIECVGDFVKEYFVENNASNTAYIEIETKNACVKITEGEEK